MLLLSLFWLIALIGILVRGQKSQPMDLSYLSGTPTL